MTHLQDKFEELANANGWGYYYARADFLNLVEARGEDDETWFMYVTPLVYEDVFDDDNTVPIERNWSGAFQILTKTDFDLMYSESITNERDRIQAKQNYFDKDIKPKFLYMDNLAKKEFCITYERTRWKYSEFVNIYDDNLAGIGVEFTIKEYL